MRHALEERFAASDGTELFYRRWPAAVSGETRGAVLLFHRGHEHSGRLQEVVDGLDLPGFEMFAWDARGHGRSPGERGWAAHFGVLAHDADAFLRHISTAHGFAPEEVAVVAQSVGAVTAAAWLHDFAPRVRCAVLASPAFEVKLYVPFAIPGLRLLQKLKDPAYIQSYVKAKFLTHDPARIASYQTDPLISRAIAVNVLIDLFDTSQRVIADAAAIQVPVQVLASGSDFVVKKGPQRRFFARLGSAEKEFHEFPGFYHDTLGEKDRHLPLGKARDFILRRFAAPSSLLDADQRGYTRDELDRLRGPAAPLAGLGFAVTRRALGSLGRLSDGVRLGLETGFDSGSTLDYVYRHRPAGRTPLGRMFDAAYLDSIGWRGIRIRRRHLEEMLAEAFARLEAAGRPVRLVDVAAGHGRYALTALGNNGHGATALLRDWSDLNVERGRALIAEMGLDGRATFERGDAFDPASLAEIPPDRTVGVVSGLYELFPANDGIRRSLAGLARAIEPGGYLLYTNQPWHPQLEFIARVLASHRGGQPWIMRRRTQGEMDELVSAAGFRKLGQRIDRWGIFSVSLAERLAERVGG
ncbi:MAG: bifunctional alpha/beta hydrolase/class I SAM-dependent methyltransferase [Thermoanaerobaculia bacterium]